MPIFSIESDDLPGMTFDIEADDGDEALSRVNDIAKRYKGKTKGQITVGLRQEEGLTAGGKDTELLGTAPGTQADTSPAFWEKGGALPSAVSSVLSTVEPQKDDSLVTRFAKRIASIPAPGNPLNIPALVEEVPKAYNAVSDFLSPPPKVSRFKPRQMGEATIEAPYQPETFPELVAQKAQNLIKHPIDTLGEAAGVVGGAAMLPANRIGGIARETGSDVLQKYWGSPTEMAPGDVAPLYDPETGKGFMRPWEGTTPGELPVVTEAKKIENPALRTVARGIAEAADEFVTPENLAMMVVPMAGAGKAGAALKNISHTAFSGMGLHQLSKVPGEVEEALNTGDEEAGVSAVKNAIMGSLMASSALKKGGGLVNDALDLPRQVRGLGEDIGESFNIGDVYGEKGAREPGKAVVQYPTGKGFTVTPEGEARQIQPEKAKADLLDAVKKRDPNATIEPLGEGTWRITHKNGMETVVTIDNLLKADAESAWNADPAAVARIYESQTGKKLDPALPWKDVAPDVSKMDLNAEGAYKKGAEGQQGLLSVNPNEIVPEEGKLSKAATLAHRLAYLFKPQEMQDYLKGKMEAGLAQRMSKVVKHEFTHLLDENGLLPDDVVNAYAKRMGIEGPDKRAEALAHLAENIPDSALGSVLNADLRNTKVQTAVAKGLRGELFGEKAPPVTDRSVEEAALKGEAEHGKAAMGQEVRQIEEEVAPEAPKAPPTAGQVTWQTGKGKAKITVRGTIVETLPDGKVRVRQNGALRDEVVDAASVKPVEAPQTPPEAPRTAPPPPEPSPTAPPPVVPSEAPAAQMAAPPVDPYALTPGKRVRWTEEGTENGAKTSRTVQGQVIEGDSRFKNRVLVRTADGKTASVPIEKLHKEAAASLQGGERVYYEQTFKDPKGGKQTRGGHAIVQRVDEDGSVVVSDLDSGRVNVVKPGDIKRVAFPDVPRAPEGRMPERPPAVPVEPEPQEQSPVPLGTRGAFVIREKGGERVVRATVEGYKDGKISLREEGGVKGTQVLPQDLYHADDAAIGERLPGFKRGDQITWEVKKKGAEGEETTEVHTGTLEGVPALKEGEILVRETRPERGQTLTEMENIPADSVVRPEGAEEPPAPRSAEEIRAENEALRKQIEAARGGNRNTAVAAPVEPPPAPPAPPVKKAESAKAARSRFEKLVEKGELDFEGGDPSELSAKEIKELLAEHDAKGSRFPPETKERYSLPNVLGLEKRAGGKGYNYYDEVDRASKDRNYWVQYDFDPEKALHDPGIGHSVDRMIREDMEKMGIRDDQPLKNVNAQGVAAMKSPDGKYLYITSANADGTPGYSYKLFEGAGGYHVAGAYKHGSDKGTVKSVRTPTEKAEYRTAQADPNGAFMRANAALADLHVQRNLYDDPFSPAGAKSADLLFPGPTDVRSLKGMAASARDWAGRIRFAPGSVRAGEALTEAQLRKGLEAIRTGKPVSSPEAFALVSHLQEGWRRQLAPRLGIEYKAEAPYGRGRAVPAGSLAGSVGANAAAPGGGRLPSGQAGGSPLADEGAGREAPRSRFSLSRRTGEEQGYRPEEAISEAIVRGKGGLRAKAVPTKEFGLTMARRLYEGDLAEVVTKELLQNAVDSVRSAGSGEVSIDLSKLKDEKRITIEDTGVGMTPDIAGSEFVNPGGTLKPEDATGGLGIAKMAIFGNAAEGKIDGEWPIQAETVARVKAGRLPDGTMARDGDYVRTRVQGDSAMYLTDGLDISFENLGPEPRPTGTKMSVALAKDINVSDYAASDFVDALADATHVPGLKLRFKRPWNREWNEADPSAGVAEATIVRVPDGSADLRFLTPDESKATETSYVAVRVLNNGLYQFTKDVWLDSPTKVPGKITVDVHALGKPQDTSIEYPFMPNRQSLRPTVYAAIKRYVDESLVNDAVKKRITALSGYIRNANRIPGKNGNAYVIDDSGRFGREALATISRRKYVGALYDGMHKAFSMMQSALVSEDGSYGRAQLGGITLNESLHGFNVLGDAVTGKQGAPNLVFLNPHSAADAAWQRLSTSAVGDVGPKDLADRAAYSTYATIVHELAHQRVRGHSSDFSRALDLAIEVLGPHESAIKSELIRAWRKAFDGRGYDEFKQDRALAEHEGRESVFGNALTELPVSGAERSGREGYPAVGATEGARPEAAFRRDAEDLAAGEGQEGLPVQRGGPRYSLSAGGKNRGYLEDVPGILREKPKLQRTDLAIPWKEPLTRDVARATDEARARAGIPNVRKDEYVDKEAIERLRKDYQGEARKIFDRSSKGLLLDDTETNMAIRIVGSEGRKLAAKKNLTAEDLVGVASLIDTYRKSGTEAARAFRQRRDPFETPEERARAFISATMFDPGLLADRIKAGDKAAIDKFERDIKKMRENMAKQGFDASNLTDEQLRNPRFVAAFVREAAASRATLGAKLYEYWANSILSGLKTHVVNTTSNLINGLWEYGLQKPTEAAIRRFGFKDMDAWDETKAMWNAFGAGVQRGFHNMAESWETEMPTLEQQTGHGLFENTAKPYGGNVAIGGRAGRIIRAPYRALRSLDEMAKGIIGEMEAAASAHRIALEELRSKKITKDQLEQRMKDLVLDTRSQAWKEAVDRAEIVTYQKALGRMGQAVMSLRRTTPLGKYVLPFVTTPMNIFGTAFRRMPGVADVRTMRSVLEARSKGWDPASKRNVSANVATQLLAWGLTGMIWAYTHDDPDAITGNEQYLSEARGEREAKRRSAPPTSIRFGKNYMNYGRVDPQASTVSVIRDVMEIARNADKRDVNETFGRIWAAVLGQIQDKTYLSGIGDLIAAIQDPTKFEKFGTNFVASWSPNIIRQPLGALEPNVRETKTWGTRKTGDIGESSADRIARRIGYKMLPIEPLAPPVRPDILGQPTQKQGSILTRLISPVEFYTPTEANPPEMVRLDKKLMTWAEDHPDAELFPRQPDPKFTRHRGIRTETIYLSDQQRYEYEKLVGELLRKRIENRDYYRTDRPLDERQASLFKRDVSWARQLARNRIQRQINSMP